MSVKPSRPAGYSLWQIVLHWLIAALVIFQLIFGEEMADAYRAFRRGRGVDADELFGANLHIWFGLAVLALAVLRLAIRLRRGVPPPSASEPPLLRRVAAADHIILYLAIFGMPVTGALAWYAGLEIMGEIHETAKPVIIIVVAVHAIAALWHHFFKRDEVLVRMLRPG